MEDEKEKTYLAEHFAELLGFVEAEDVGLSEDVVRLNIALQLGYYDAAFLFLGGKHGVLLVCDGGHLLRKGVVSSRSLRDTGMTLLVRCEKMCLVCVQ